MRLSSAAIWLAGAAIAPLAAAVDIDWSSEDSIKEGAGTIAYGLMKYYTGNNTGDTPGNLPDPYYWWECGAMFGTMVEYWAYTGDETYVNVTYQAMQHQIGDDKDYMPENQTRSLGNDDQGFWAVGAMTAAERNFLNPNDTEAGGTQWVAIVQAVWAEFVTRWDAEDCGGGLRWQIYPFNNGYTYKNSISNGIFFDISARLARYTGNETYAGWAVKIWDWMEDIQFIDADYNVYDGAGFADGANCTIMDKTQFSYNAGAFLHGAAVMYNYTDGAAMWRTRLEGLVATTASYFFPENQVMQEPSCEPSYNCNLDAQSFKTYLATWIGKTVQIATFTYDTFGPLLTASAKMAAQHCVQTTGVEKGPAFSGHPGTACGMKWTEGATVDPQSQLGVGPQMAALAVVFASQVNNWNVAKPFTESTGGTSVGDSSAGTNKDQNPFKTFGPITTGDRVGAGFLTSLILAGVIGGCSYLIKDETGW